MLLSVLCRPRRALEDGRTLDALTHAAFRTVLAACALLARLCSWSPRGAQVITQAAPQSLTRDLDGGALVAIGALLNLLLSLRRTAESRRVRGLTLDDA